MEVFQDGLDIALLDDLVLEQIILGYLFLPMVVEQDHEGLLLRVVLLFILNDMVLLHLIYLIDELVFEVPEAETEALASLVTAAMEDVVALSVPLVANAGWGPTWLEAH